MSEDEFDNMPDDFADISGVDWARILGPSDSNPTSAGDHLPGTGPIPSTSSRSSTDYFEDDEDDFDASLLAELDRIEGELAETHHSNSRVEPQHSFQSTSDLRPSHYFSALNTQKKRKDIPDPQPGEEPLNVFLKKQRLDDTSCLTSSHGKGKMKANDDTLSQILSSYEDEIICPICCDFYAFAHISNPCGHSFCGGCGRDWHMKNKSCPVCRTRLENASPMIPNIAIDNVVEKHIRALALSGDQDWESGGLKAEEWNKRKQIWRNDAIEREKKKSSAAHRTRTFIPSIIDLTSIQVFNPGIHIEDNLETDPNYEDPSDVELIPRPIRRRRQRQRAAPSAVVNHG